MKKQCLTLGLVLTSIFMATFVVAQKEPSKIVQEAESAEVFLEEYTDEFQETFFEALKQKGIQNYDRAINLLLDSKQLNADNEAINHELAKTYFLDKKYVQAQEHAIAALNAQPENYWFLDTLMKILQKQGVPLQHVESNIPWSAVELKMNVVKWYFASESYRAAKEILATIKSHSDKEVLSQRIEEALGRNEKSTGLIQVENTSPQEIIDLELQNFKNTMKLMVKGSNYLELEKKAKLALQAYPLQPEFYYYRGLALNKTEQHVEAVDILEEGLDYLFDNDRLANDFYKELLLGYNALGNVAKAETYRSKIKPGL